MKNAREICLSALVRMEKDGAYSNLVLNSLLSKCNLSHEEKSFATRLFYGTLEKKLLLDFNISLLSKRPPQKLDVEVLCILRMGMYQLLFLDSIPDSAAVNESVKLCSFTKKTSAKGFVNALLRAKLRQNKEVCIPKAINEELSADKSIVSLISEQYGEGELRDIFSAFSENSRQYIKVNTRKTTLNELCAVLKEKNIEIKPCDRAHDCAEIQGAGDLTNLLEFKNGLFYVQDLASQLCCAALEAEGAERILDVCAAPGGKSFTLALLAPKSAEVVSCDVSSNRVSLIEKGKERLGLSNVKPQINDATVFNKALGSFDRILCDVPCSGLGVIGKKPEIRYKRIKPQELFEVQYKILETSSQYLNNGGILVYSTCTINKIENEAVIAKFLEEHSEFAPHPLCITESGEYHKTFLPDRDGCDGFFVSAIIKNIKGR
ncbi:MAG: 16S rRNA (cytosine(967)-C(5))-methyltransferase RsmB [Oscillospiraceae bacterium]|nr:16S rRNA (cytosine(967)-C(5))-methyltransferase RsmB [Oscillospiraceae bacterium]